MEDDEAALAIDSKKRSDAEIYGEHAVSLVQFATVLVGAGDAQDVVSSAVLRSLGSPGWRQVQNYRSYLHQAVANEARNLFRSESRRRKREVRMSQPTVVYLPELRPEVQRAVDGGIFDGLVRKPFGLDELYGAVERLAGKGAVE